MFLVGIDLGTTHTVVACADLESGPSPEIFDIDQLVAPAEVASRPLLPSLRYHPAPGELADTDMLLPWPDTDMGIRAPAAVLGELARELGSRVPGRLVASAKSWLSHRLVDRLEPILPWGAGEGVDKISPLLASAGYLAHVRCAWNQRHREHPLQEQEIVLTVPASFDESARALTVEAAAIAGLPRVHLVEEPQAACYDWLAHHTKDLRRELEDVRLLLVCDVGGGTTDFTLIRVGSDSGRSVLTRIGVGDHLMLGGDNMDLALAHVAEGRIVTSGAKLTAAALSQLIQQCRSAKERLLSPGAAESATVTVLGSGARLVGASRSTELTREEVQQMLVEGFFPHCAPEDRPRRIRSGIVEFGLPYVADPAVTRHAAAFLAHQAGISGPSPEEAESRGAGLTVPDAVLLNGGVFRGSVLSNRFLEVLEGWRGSPVRQLLNKDPHLAVARGAVAYGLSRRGRGVRIGGGSARSYFLMLADEGEKGARKGVCLLPRGADEGKEIRLEERTFSLRLHQPVRFHLVSSSGGRNYQPGELADVEAETFTHLPPIATVISEAGGAREIPVQLAAVLTEVGTLEVRCIAAADPAKHWTLEFQLRNTGGASASTAPELHPRFGEAIDRIARIFGARSRQVEHREVKALRRELESILGSREQWDTPLLREMSAALWSKARHRRRSSDHEKMWLNLAGYCLRPGYGYPLDDWRVQQLWNVHDQGIQYVHETQVWLEWWTMWRRVAGGLDRHSQERLLEDIRPDLDLRLKKTKPPSKAPKPGHDNMVALAGTLETLPQSLKVELGEMLLELLRKPGESTQTWWALGRIGARVPVYGSIHNVVPAAIAEEWLERTLSVNWNEAGPAALAAMLLARMSGDRERDIDPRLRERVAARLQALQAPPSWIQMVREPTEPDEADERHIFGESLPPGLRLI